MAKMELPMKKHSRWNRLIVAVFSLLAFSSQAHGLDSHPSKHLANYNTFVATEKFDKCVSNLHLVDSDDDLRLEREEYVYFIFLQSDGRLNYEGFPDLPLSLLANYLFTACFCSLTQGPGCCVGDNIGIQLDEEGEVFISSVIINFCISIDMAIQDLLTPTPSPSLVPTRPPTPVPTSPPTTTAPSSTPSIVPTISASEGPTGTPTSSPTASPSSTPTGAPTTIAPSSAPSATPSITASDVPSLVPTESPTSRPTMAPVPGQTDMPTTAPSQAPTKSPTLVPTQAPTKSPSSSPTEIPSVEPTSAPTKSPTEQPSTTPTAAPSITPTPAPSTPAPSTSPTQTPTPENLTCVRFQYGISNDNGFSASDIFNEVNNTYKTGLLIATRNVTVETLNATYPRDGSGRFLRGESDWRHHIEPPLRNDQANKKELKFEGFGGLGTRDLQDYNLQSFVLHESKPGKSLRSNGNRRRTVYLPQEESDDEMIDISQLSRQLVFYTDEYPVRIDAIFDNPFCRPSNPITRCAVVASTVCALLEDGDDEGEVGDVIIAGIQISIKNGEFEDAIPPEHQFPPV